jgi:hypothetical protein
MAFDESKPEPFGEPNTNNSTKFYPYDKKVPDGFRESGFILYYRFYDKLMKINRGTHRHLEHDPRQIVMCKDMGRRDDNLNIFDAISDSLDIIDGRRRWAKKLFGRFDYKKYSQPDDQGGTVMLLAVCTCAYVCWKDGLNTHPNHPEKDPRFIDMLQELGIDNGEFQKWYGKMENEIRRRWGEGYI